MIGASSGIGRGIALGLADEAMAVVAADIDVGSASRVAKEIVSAGGEATAAEVDPTDRASLRRLAEDVLRSHGAAHIVANTVGVILERKLEDLTEEGTGSGSSS